jgi:hypothetical protein
MKTNNHWSRVPLLLACLLLFSCAGTGNSNNIEVRAQTRWDSLLGGDLAGAYEFLSPGLRSSIGSLDYQRVLLMTKVRWTAAEVLESECDEDACTVKVNIKFLLLGAVPGVKKFEGHQVISESWVRVDGQWWYVPQE